MSIPLNVVVLDPTAERATRRPTRAPRIETLDGAVVGVIWNSRPHGDKVLRAVVELLQRQYALKEVVFRRKPYLGNMAPREIYDELAARCSAAIVGVGD